MRILLAISIFLVGLGMACSSNGGPPTASKKDGVAEPGVTQPSPPEPGSVATNNPRDPKNKKPREVNEVSVPPAPTEPRPAPENSEASVQMNEDGSITEFRVFHDHPVIVRAEANWMDPRTKSLKVVLKNGKTLTATTTEVPYLNDASSDELLRVVGAKARTGDRPRIVKE